jgi:hypothetical protein
MATPETQYERDDAAGGFTQRMQQYQAQLAMADRATNPWLTVSERDQVRLVLSSIRSGAIGRATVVGT